MRTFCTHFPKYPENLDVWVFCENREKWGFFKPRKWRKPESGAQICGDPRRIIYCLDTRSGPQKRGFWGFCENPCFGGTANRVCTLCTRCAHTPSHSGSGCVHVCTLFTDSVSECCTFWNLYIYAIHIQNSTSLGTAEKIATCQVCIFRSQARSVNESFVVA